MISIYSYGQVPAEKIFARSDDGADVSAAVRDIVANVQKDGDAALRRYALQFDKAQVERLEVSEEELDAAVASLEPALVELLQEAAARIRAFHRHQVREGFVVSEEEGVVLGQKVIPLDRVGLYLSLIHI